MKMFMKRFIRFRDLFSLITERRCACLVMLIIVICPEISSAKTETISSFTSISGTIGEVIYNSYKGGGISNPVVSNNTIRLSQNSNGDTGGYIVLSVPDDYRITNVSLQSKTNTIIGYYVSSNPGDSTPAKTDFIVNNKSLKAGITYTISNLQTKHITFACFGTTSEQRLHISSLSITYEEYVISNESDCSLLKLTSDLSVAATYTQGEPANTLSVTAEYNGSVDNLTYQWYSNTEDDITTGLPITGAISNTYTPWTTTLGTMYYYCIATYLGDDNVTCEIISTSAKITTIKPLDYRWIESKIDDIDANDEVIITMTNGITTWALDYSKGTDDYPPAINITRNGPEVLFFLTYHKNCIWNVCGNSTTGYMFYPNGNNSKWLYCTKSDYNLKVGNYSETSFVIENDYLKHTNIDENWVAYVGVYTNEQGVSTWRKYSTNMDNAISNQTLKFYKKVCIPDERNDIPIVEWKTDGVIVMYNGTSSTATIAIGNAAAVDVELVKKDHAIYELPIETLATSTGQQLSIGIDDKTTICTIPYIISSENAVEVSDNSDLVILHGGKYSATNQSLRNVTIYGGGALVVDEGTDINMNALTMRIGAVDNEGKYMYAYPQLLLTGTLQIASSQINLDYLTTYDRYYSLALPYEVATTDIHYPTDIYGENVAADNTGSFALQYYDGAARAVSGKGWTDLEEPATLQPYQGYTFWGAPKKIQVGESDPIRQKYGIHRIPMKVSTPLSENTDKEIPITAYAASSPNDMGWNYLGNPYLAQHGSLNMDNEANGLRYVTTTWDGNIYESLRVQDALFEPFNTFFVQVETNGTLLFEQDRRSILALANRHGTAEMSREIEAGIVITGKEQTDRTGLLIADSFTDAYEVNADLAKFENKGTNIYTIGQAGKLAFMAVNQSMAKEGIALGYSVPAEGSYTIAFDAAHYRTNGIHALYLMDYDCNVTTDLLEHDYSFTTAVGTYDERFVLQVLFAPKVSTDIGGGNVDIVRVWNADNGVKISNLPIGSMVSVYDAVGHVIASRLAKTSEMHLPIQTGYYIVHITSETRVITINITIP